MIKHEPAVLRRQIAIVRQEIASRNSEEIVIYPSDIKGCSNRASLQSVMKAAEHRHNERVAEMREVLLTLESLLTDSLKPSRRRRTP